MDCLFCKIAQGDNIIYKDDQVVAFKDINPQALHHIIIIPQKHIATVNDLQEENINLVGHMVLTATRLAKQLNIADDGYRLVMNCNSAGGQTVFHIHLHLLGGRPMHWPPG